MALNGVFFVANRRKMAIQAFCAAHFIALGALEYASKAGEEWCSLIGQALLMSQWALLATWIALGSTPGRTRKTMLLLFFAGLINAAIDSGLRNFGGRLVALVVASFFGGMLLTILALPWVKLKGRGFELIDLRESPQRDGEESFQFSLRQTFVWTTVIALLFAVGQWLPRADEINNERTQNLAPFLGVLLFVGLILQYIAVMRLAGWAVLSRGDWRPRLAIILSTALILGPLLPYYLGGELLDYGFSTGLWLAYAALLSASLYFFRVCGYRLVRVDSFR